ncbi:MAG: hypothetical protein WBL28_10840 [Methylotenera sp.]
MFNDNKSGSEYADIQAIKAVSVSQIEDGFSKALKELTGNSYKVNISKLNLDSEYNKSFIELVISSPAPF